MAEPETGGRLHLRADSDAVLVKGLISLLLRLVPPAHRTERSLPPVPGARGPVQAAYPGRSNGLQAMVVRIRAMAEAFAAARPA